MTTLNTIIEEEKGAQKTNEDLIAEMRTMRCIVCGGDGYTVEADPWDQTGQTPMQAQCDACHAEGEYTTLDEVLSILTLKDEAHKKEMEEALKTVESMCDGHTPEHEQIWHFVHDRLNTLTPTKEVTEEAKPIYRKTNEGSVELTD